MNNIEKVKNELKKHDCLAKYHVIENLKILPDQNTLYIKGIINGEVFTSKAKEFSVFANNELSIIL